MIYVVSGAVNSGKTTRLQEIYATLPPATAGGFVSAKLMADKLIGYEIRCLSTNLRIPLAVLSNDYNGQYSKPLFFDRFVFDQRGFEYGSSIINQLVENNTVQDIFIDEIGPLELERRGFYQAFRMAILSKKNVYVTIRSSCLRDVVADFDIREYTIIEP